MDPLPDPRYTKKLTFHENVKLTNGKTSTMKRYFPTNEGNAELRNSRRSAPKTFPAPSFPFAKIKPSVAPYLAQIMAKNISTMDELEDEVYSLDVSPEDKGVILTRMKYLYGNNLVPRKSNLNIDMAAARAKQQRAERLARLRAETQQRIAAAPVNSDMQNLSNRMRRMTLQSPKPVATNNEYNLYSGGKRKSTRKLRRKVERKN